METVAEMGMGQYNKVKGELREREIKAWKVEIEQEDRIKMIISKGKGRVGGG